MCTLSAAVCPFTSSGTGLIDPPETKPIVSKRESDVIITILGGDKIPLKSVESSMVPIINGNANITATSWEAERFPIEDKRRLL